MSPRSSRRLSELAAGFVICLLVLTSVVVAPPAGAATFTVTNGNDAGPGSFRQAVVDASADTLGPVVIDFEPGLSVMLSSGVARPLYTNTLDLTINGNGSSVSPGGLSTFAAVTTINDLSFSDGGDLWGGAVSARGDLRIIGSTFSGNGTGFTTGGAIFAEGDVSVTDSYFRDNNVRFFHGGAIFALGDVTARSSTFSHNSAEVSSGGAIAAAGDVSVTDSSFVANSSARGGAVSASTVTITGSTFSTNDALDLGGAVEGDAVDITNSTFSYNGADSGGAVFATGETTLAHATLLGNSAPEGSNVTVAALSSFGSVVADPAGGGTSCSVGTTISSYSYDDDASCAFVGTGDTSGGPNPAVGELTSNGGPNSTRLPGNLSPLLDAIPPVDCHATVVTDQRGVERPQGPGCDIGAVEVEVEVTDPDPPPPEPDSRPPEPPVAGPASTPQPALPGASGIPRNPAAFTTPTTAGIRTGSPTTTLPHTGSSTWQALAVALCLISLGGAFVTWVAERDRRVGD